MATVSKTNLSIKIYLHNGDTYEVADGEKGNLATSVMYQFNAKDTVKVVEDDKDTYIPFHSILKIEVKQSTTESEVTNDICKVEDDSADDGGDDNNGGE